MGSMVSVVHLNGWGACSSVARTLACHMVIDVAVMTAKTWPVRETRRARIGSLSGIHAGSDASAPLPETSEAVASKRLCSTGLMAGVWGVRGVPGMGASTLEAESAVRRLVLSAFSPFCPGKGIGRPSWERVILVAAGGLLLVA